MTTSNHTMGRPTHGRPIVSPKARHILRHVLVRLLFIIPTVLGVTFLVFAVGAISGNDPGLTVLGIGADPSATLTFAKAHGLDDPLVVRYVRYVQHVFLHGDFGVTLVTKEPIADRMRSAAPVTIWLAILGSMFALTFGVALGLMAAIWRNSLADRAVLVISSVGHAMPAFWTGLLIIQVFAVKYDVIPSGGYTQISDGLGAWMRSMIAPALALAIPFGTALARIVRGATVEELDKEYVRTAEGLGLTLWVIMFRNVLRNAFAAPLTAFGLGLGTLLSGAIIVEALFQLPGLGQFTVEGIKAGDYGIVAAVGIFGSVAFVVVNTVIDLTCWLLNPREVTLTS